MVNLIELPINPMETAEDTPFLANYFPKPVPPLNITLRCFQIFFCGKQIGEWCRNFVAKFWHITYHRAPHQICWPSLWIQRNQSFCKKIWKVVEDPFTINGSSELGGELGSFGAGVAANKMADKYMEEMVETSFTLKASEKLNQRIYQQFAKEMGSDPSLVRGTGFSCQFVPHASRGNILDRPSRGSRPLWAQKPFQGLRGPFGFITPLVFHKRSALQLSKFLLTKKK